MTKQKQKCKHKTKHTEKFINPVGTFLTYDKESSRCLEKVLDIINKEKQHKKFIITMNKQQKQNNDVVEGFVFEQADHSYPYKILFRVNDDGSRSIATMKDLRKAHEQGARDERERIKDFCEAIIKADKTERYEYGTGESDRNRYGELPEAGSRWATPREMAQQKLQSLTNKE